MMPRSMERIRYRCPEVYAGWWDARRTPHPTLGTARRIGTSGYVVGYAVAILSGAR